VKDIILCSSNTILIKNLYGVLRDEGYNVDTVEHPAHAVKKVLGAKYDFCIVDTEPFGLSAEDAAYIIRTVMPGMPVVVMGGNEAGNPGPPLPLDLEAFRRTIHSIAV
jgi:DNA-binding NtrC family response regulator